MNPLMNPETKTRRLIITADDLGYAPAVTRGLVEAHQRGVVTAASLMVNLPASAEAAATVVADTPALDVGLHLNLTRGKPVAPMDEVRDLVDRDGNFRLRSAEELAAVPLEQIERELRAQCDRFVALRQHSPTHVGLHRRWLDETPAGTVALNLAREHGAVVRARTAKARQRAAELGVRTCDHVIGNVTIRGSEPEWTFDHLLRSLARLESGVTELVCHPGYAYDEELRASAYHWQREAEHRLFASPQAREYVERFAQLADFSVIRELSSNPVR